MDFCAHDEGMTTPAPSKMMIKVVAPPEKVYSVQIPSAELDLEGRVRIFLSVHRPQQCLSVSLHFVWRSISLQVSHDVNELSNSCCVPVWLSSARP